GAGTKFKVYLPLVGERVEAVSVTSEEAADQKATETILLVEDEEAVRELALMILEAQGYTVLVAESSAHAEQLAARGADEIQLLLTDVVMPGGGGRELARRITARNS